MTDARPGGGPAPPPVALSIAGSDSGGGAGVQADLKTFQRFGVYGTSALSVVTAQSTRGVLAVHVLPPELVVQQIDAVADDFAVAAAKTGALGSAAVVEAVADAVVRHAFAPLVVDPVMVSKQGDPLLDDDAADALAAQLLPHAAVATPNLLEAARILGRPVEDEAAMRDAAHAVLDRGARAVVVTGGGRTGHEAIDLLYDGGRFVRLTAARVKTPHTHGTGCTFSAAIAALLARGRALEDAVREAKAYVTRAIAAAPGLGHGRGPVDHGA